MFNNSGKIIVIIKKAFSLWLVTIMSALPMLGIYIDFGGVHTLRGQLSYDYAYSTEKIMQKDLLGHDKDFTMHMAKNEREGCQIVLRVRYNSTKNVSLTVDDFIDENGNTLAPSIFKESYISVGTGIEAKNYPDALIPFENGSSCELDWQVNQPFYIEVKTDKNTPAGTYTANVTLKDTVDAEFEIKSKLSVVVWNFELPSDPMMDTAMGIGSSTFFTLNGVTPNTPQGDALYKQYYDFLLDHKISGYNLPYDIMSKEAEAYMSNPAVTSFIIPYFSDDATLVKYYQKVQSNPVWAEKGCFYPIDEPHSLEHQTIYSNITDRLARLCPGYNMVTPFFSLEIKDENTGVPIKNFEMQNGKSNVICPISSIYSEQGFKQAVAERVNKGNKSWWYVCCGPTGDYCNFFIHLPGIKHRILFWQQKQNDVTGLLYWNTVYWDKALDPWASSKTWDSYESAGDGSLLYPGKMVGVDGPVASIRLKNITNGIDDYGYFTMAERLFGREWLDAKLAQISTSLTDYTSSDELLEKVRCEIGEAIAAKA